MQDQENTPFHPVHGMPGMRARREARGQGQPEGRKEKMTGCLLIDIDGVLNPYFETWEERKNQLTADGWQYFQ